ncbi:hypothetical protein ABK040_013041 [Willaertia magna]
MSTTRHSMHNNQQKGSTFHIQPNHNNNTPTTNKTISDGNDKQIFDQNQQNKRKFEDYQKEQLKLSSSTSLISPTSTTSNVTTKAPITTNVVATNNDSSSINSTATTNDTNASSGGESAVDKKKARLEAWKKKKELLGISANGTATSSPPTSSTTVVQPSTESTTTSNDLTESKKANTSASMITATNDKSTISKASVLGSSLASANNASAITTAKKPLIVASLGAKKVNNNVNTMMDMDEMNDSMNNNLKKDNVMNDDDDDDDPLEQFMNTVHHKIEEEEKQKKKQLTTNNTTNLKKEVILSNNDEDTIGILDSYFIAKEELEDNHHGMNKEPGNTANNLELKKELKKVNHDLINYPTIRKNFLVLSNKYKNLTETEKLNLRKNFGNIKVYGKDIPPPIKEFYSLGLNEQVLNVIEKKMKYKECFPIQAQAIPCIMSGRDVIGIARTGSGKTLAYVLPLLRHVLDQVNDPNIYGSSESNNNSGLKKGPIGVILVPTRELAVQITSEINKFLKELRYLHVLCAVGGTPISEQISELKKHDTCIVVATPGRLVELLVANKGKVINLYYTSFVVLDEADRLFDEGFGYQVMKILDNIRPDRQLVMFSATFPRVLEALAKKILNNPIEINIGNKAVACDHIKQYVELFENEDTKVLKLLELLDSQNQVGHLYSQLLNYGYKDEISTLHGGMDQIERDLTLDDFKHLKTNILITTSISSRGLDVPECHLVINYNCPDHYEDYIHRIGRTGRANREGTAYTFILKGKDDKYLNEVIIKALKKSNQNIPNEILELNDLYLKKIKFGIIHDNYHKRKGNGFINTSGYKFNFEETLMKKEEKKLQQLSYVLSHNSSTQDDNNTSLLQEEDLDIPQHLLEKQQEKEKEQQQKKKKEWNMLEKAAHVAEVAVKDIIPNEEMDMEIEKAKLFAAALTVQQSQQLKQQEKVFKQSILNSIILYNGIYVTEIEVNDLPYPLRNELTYKKEFKYELENLFMNVNMEVKGMYIPPDKINSGGNQQVRKLYIRLEGKEEEQVQRARNYILNKMKLLFQQSKEEMLVNNNNNHELYEKSHTTINNNNQQQQQQHFPLFNATVNSILTTNRQQQQQQQQHTITRKNSLNTTNKVAIKDTERATATTATTTAIIRSTTTTTTALPLFSFNSYFLQPTSHAFVFSFNSKHTDTETTTTTTTSTTTNKLYNNSKACKNIEDNNNASNLGKRKRKNQMEDEEEYYDSNNEEGFCIIPLEEEEEEKMNSDDVQQVKMKRLGASTSTSGFFFFH